MRACPYAMALQIKGLPLDENGVEAQVLLPSENKSVGRRKRIEKALYAAYVERDVFARDDEIGVHWPEDLDVSVELTARLEHASERIYAEGHKVGIREARRDALSMLKDMEGDGSLPQDDRHRADKQVQDITDEFTKKIDEMTTQKEKEVLEV